MNALEKIKEGVSGIKDGVSGGVKAIEGRLAKIENDAAEAKALREQQREENKALRARQTAEAAAAKEQERALREKEKEKAARERERARNRKRRALMLRRSAAGALVGLIVIAVGVWYTLHGLEILTVQLPVEPVWALGMIAAGAAAMITGRGIPVKAGIIVLGLLILVRENGWLWGVLGSVSVWHLVCAAAVLVAVIYITMLVIMLKNGAMRGWMKARKAIREQKENMRLRVSEVKDKLRKH